MIDLFCSIANEMDNPLKRSLFVIGSVILFYLPTVILTVFLRNKGTVFVESSLGLNFQTFLFLTFGSAVIWVGIYVVIKVIYLTYCAVLWILRGYW